MAIYNEILVGRYARSLQKLFGIKGTVPAKQLAGELMPVHQVFNGAENRYLESWFRFGAATTVPNVAAQTSVFRFRNPKGSNVIAVIEKLTLFEAAADTYTFGNLNPDVDLGGAISGNPFDIRSRAQSTCLLSVGNNTSPAAQLFRIQIQAAIMIDVIWTDIQEIPLLPGDDLEWSSTSVNVAPTSSLIWRERFLEDSERT